MNGIFSKSGIKIYILPVKLLSHLNLFHTFVFLPCRPILGMWLCQLTLIVNSTCIHLREFQSTDPGTFIVVPPEFISYIRFPSLQTYIGNVVVSINPYRKFNLYTPERISEYRSRNIYELPPHM